MKFPFPHCEQDCSNPQSDRLQKIESEVQALFSEKSDEIKAFDLVPGTECPVENSPEVAQIIIRNLVLPCRQSVAEIARKSQFFKEPADLQKFLLDFFEMKKELSAGTSHWDAMIAMAPAILNSGIKTQDLEAWFLREKDSLSRENMLFFSNALYNLSQYFNPKLLEILTKKRA